MSVEIYYTGASSIDAVQRDPSVSLGGNKSNTKVPNNRIDNVFSQESYLSVNQGSKQTRCIILKAVTALDNLKIGIVKKSDFSDNVKIYLGFTDIGSNNTVEQLFDSASEPFNTEFNSEAYMADENDTDNMFAVLASVSAGNCVAIWIKREFSNNYDGNNLIESLSSSKSELSQNNISSGFDLVMSWDTP